MKVWSVNFANLATKLVAVATSLQIDRERNERLVKPSHKSTSSENLVKVGVVDSEIMDEKFDR